MACGHAVPCGSLFLSFLAPVISIVSESVASTTRLLSDPIHFRAAPLPPLRPAEMSDSGSDDIFAESASGGGAVPRSIRAPSVCGSVSGSGPSKGSSYEASESSKRSKGAMKGDATAKLSMKKHGVLAAMFQCSICGKKQATTEKVPGFNWVR